MLSNRSTVKLGSLPLLLNALIITKIATGIASAATVYTTADSEFHVKRDTGTAVVGGNLHVKRYLSSNGNDRFGILRFDSTSFGANVNTASFSITAEPDTVTLWQDTFSYNVYGVIDGDAQDEAVSEATYNPNAANALFDNSDDMIDASQLTLLGSLDNVSAGDTVTLSSAALLSFLQADTNDIATLVIIRTNGDGGNSVFMDSTATNSADRPQLSFTTIPEPSTALLALFGSLVLLRRRR